MKYRFSKTIVIALGGSIVFPDQIDTNFLKNFKKFLAPFLKKKIKFILVIGGGRLARVFQAAAQEVSALTDEDKDWIGIHSTRLNAHLLRTIFRKIADPIIIDSKERSKKLSAKGGSASGGKYPITIASGWRPGWSTDFVASAIAKDFKVSEFIVAGKPAFVYPIRGREGPQRASASNGVYHLDESHPFFELSWKNYRKLIPSKWAPGSHAPVDPIAAKFSDRAKIKAIIINGKDLKNFNQLLNRKDFRGTIIG